MAARMSYIARCINFINSYKKRTILMDAGSRLCFLAYFNSSLYRSSFNNKFWSTEISFPAKHLGFILILDLVLILAHTENSHELCSVIWSKLYKFKCLLRVAQGLTSVLSWKWFFLLLQTVPALLNCLGPSCSSISFNKTQSSFVMICKAFIILQAF